MESEIEVTSSEDIDGKALEKPQENEAKEIEEIEEIEEEVKVMKAKDQLVEEVEEHDPWWDNDEESNGERTPVSNTEIKRCKRLFRYGDDSSNVSFEYNSHNYALSH